MSCKKAVLKSEQYPYAFYFPVSFPDEIIDEHVRAIRIGERRNWSREFRELEIEITTIEKADFDDEHKFVVMGKEGELQVMVVFPKKINHDYMFEVVQHASFDLEMDISHRCVSAGFVYKNGECHGRSETLDKESRPNLDTKLFKETFK